MTREILFRGKRIDNGEWVEGFYVHLPCGRLEQDEHLIQTIRDTGKIGTIMRVDPDTIGQYIGTDKNGDRIFEGDIVDASEEWWNASGPAGHESPTLLVEWNDYHCGFDPFANYDCDCGVYINSSGCKVIGNKWDNPELLEGDE